MSEIRIANLKNIKTISKKLKENHTSIKSVYLFGSYAKQKQDEWSDIDLAVILQDTCEYEECVKIYSEGKEYDDRVDALAFSQEDFEFNRLPIIDEIKSTGIQII